MVPDMRGRTGQASVETVLVMVATIMVATALALLWRASQEGDLSRIAVHAASHTFSEGIVGALKDIALY
jgi:hypothetical protein